MHESTTADHPADGRRPAAHRHHHGRQRPLGEEPVPAARRRPPPWQGGGARDVRACGERGVEYLTLFAFSSENWRRPADEVSVLKQLFRAALEQEVSKLNEVGIRLRVVGNLAPFGETIVGAGSPCRGLTAVNRRLTLTIAANYGGRWDLLQAINAMARAHPERAGGYTEARARRRHLAMSYAPEPDLFVRTGGEQRISNFLLWQLAYCRVLLHRYPVAGLRRRGPGRRHRVVPPARTPLRSHERAARRGTAAAATCRAFPTRAAGWRNAAGPRCFATGSSRRSGSSPRCSRLLFWRPPPAGSVRRRRYRAAAWEWAGFRAPAAASRVPMRP